jgi:hypothetical protein
MKNAAATPTPDIFDGDSKPQMPHYYPNIELIYSAF